MRVVIFIIMVVLLMSCNTDNPSAVTHEYVYFSVLSGTSYVKEAKIYNKQYIIQYGILPMSIAAEQGDSITAYFEVRASNFGSNHPECNCIISGADYYQCTQGLIVNGDDWYIAAGDTILNE